MVAREREKAGHMTTTSDEEEAPEPESDTPAPSIRRVVIVAVAGACVLGLVAVVLAMGGKGATGTTTAPTTSVPASAQPLASVCNLVARVGADYNAKDKAADARLQQDVAALDTAAQAFGPPFSDTFATAQAAAQQGDVSGILSAVEAMATDCTTRGYKP